MVKSNPFPLLSSAQITRITQEIESTLDSHRNWAKAIIEKLVCRSDLDIKKLCSSNNKFQNINDCFSNETISKLREHSGFYEVVECFSNMQQEASHLKIIVNDIISGFKNFFWDYT